MVLRSKYGPRVRLGKLSHELLVFKTNRNIFASVNSISTGEPVFSISTLTLKKNGIEQKADGKLSNSLKVGEMVAERCKELKLSPVINIANYGFHGRVKSLVEGFNGSLTAECK